MKTVRPKPLGAQFRSLSLTPEEGFVLSRIDGHLSLSDLVALTGIEADRIERIVDKLAGSGAIALEPAEPSGPLPEAGSLPDVTIAGPDDDIADATAPLSILPPRPSSPPSSHGPRDSKLPSSGASGSVPPLDDAKLLDDGEPEAASEPESEHVRANEHNFREVHRTKFATLPPDTRVQFARIVSGSDLFALCFDVDPRVVAGILENARSGLDHVRLLAQHHGTHTGLEMISRRTDWLRDALVERRLLRNPQCGDVVLGRVITPKRLLATYKICNDRDVPEITRAKTRGFLRQKFATAAPDARADLVIRTEGRCLMLLTGCTIDGKATQILCARPYNSTLFVQNLAKFSATPPPLLAHLVKQPLVRRSAPLRKMLLQHPNMPGDVKRQL